MAAAHMVDDRGEHAVTLRRVTEDAVGGASLNGVNHRGRRHEIHVGDPARDDVLVGVLVGVLVPLGAVRAGAFRAAVEIESHGLKETLG